MAEKDACLAIENAVEQLEQAPATGRGTHKLRSLITGLRFMNTLVKELEDQDYEEEVADWLQRVREIAYDTQDVIGSVVADTHLQNQKSKLGRLLSGKRVTKHDGQIESIENRIEEICSFPNKSCLGQSSSQSDQVVGFEDAQKTLVRQLIDEARPKREVILIYGKRGCGKTTLAKMVFNCLQVEEQFDCQVWESFPKELPLEKMLCRILKRAGSSSNEIDSLYKDELKDELLKSFKGKRYLVVVDNVNNSDTLNELISLFPEESNGSRILLASRMDKADLQLRQRLSFSHEVRPLNENQSWQLFSKKVFGKESDSSLKKLGEEMVRKCKGSPGAITALAAILNSAKKNKDMWLKILRGYDDVFQFDDHIKELAIELQFCLVYFGVFSDHKIPAKQMIQMWMAEGLLKQRGCKRAEEIGEQYLKELNSKSFIQLNKRSDESLKTCYTLGHISQECISKGAEWKLFEVHLENSSEPQKDIRRMAVHSDSNSITDVLKRFGNCSHVHSLHCFGTSPTPIHSDDFWRTLIHKFCNLNVLNLGFLELDKVPKELGKLKLLRYLRVKAPNVKHLPSSVVNLHQLETLDMRESWFTCLPHGLWKMQLLRHLYLGGSTPLPNTNQIDYYKTLPNLQTLSGVRPGKNLKRQMVRAKFPNVTKLRIYSLDSKLTKQFLNSLDHLCHLQSLRLENHTELPDPDAFPLSLTKLTLFKTKLQQECIKTLGKLPNLRTLKLLKEAFSEKKIESDGGFLQLECLYIENSVVETWKLKRGAMQGVKHFFTKEPDTDWEIAPDSLRRSVFAESEEDGTR